MSAADRWLRRVLQDGERRKCAAHIERLAPQDGATAPWPPWVPEELAGSFAHAGIARPWRHQAEAAEAMWSGHHTAVATAAGSGKTLGLWLAPLASLHVADTVGRPAHLAERRRAPTALYLSPTKALGADQLAGLTRLTANAGGPDVFRAVVCDGDAGFAERRWAQATARAVLTNPDYLHFSLLAHHAHWSRFLAGLRWVLVDEAHVYRGLFGAHVALVMRRLRRVARHYGAVPTFALASATIADPQATGAALLGFSPDDITCVSD
ncbi:MAG: DEAD/DEAH box helicase, partial [Bifidobacteriaceae bacterium]|nr:DEAD/DEAH box helicase [Bifidobacteriaceae bacterium]